MLKRCVIPDCSLEGDFSEFFPFPKDLKFLDQWISKLPLLNISSLNLKSAEICEHHFNPKELKDGLGFQKELLKNAIPEYFPSNEEIDWESCRFCLKKLEGGKLPLDDLIKTHYQNLMQEELNMDFPQSFACEDCFHAIRNSSHIKSKIQENQIKLSNFSPKLRNSEFLEIKMEVFVSDEDIASESVRDPDSVEKTAKIKKVGQKTKGKKGKAKTILKISEDRKG